MKQGWLRQIDWQTIVSLNKAICDGHNATHGPTSDGYAHTEAFWLEKHRQELTLTEAIGICGKCHHLAPFCNYNGATFTTVIRDCIAQFTGITAQQAAAIRSIAGHMVAGTATPEEITQFGPLIENLDKPVSTLPAPAHSFAVNDRVQRLKGTLTGVVIETTREVPRVDSSTLARMSTGEFWLRLADGSVHHKRASIPKPKSPAEIKP